MVSVRTHLPEDAAGSATIHADLEVQFAGQTAQYKQVPLQLATQGNEAKISGTIPATLTDFQDRSAIASSVACEERNTRPRRDDLAEAEMICQPDD